MIKALIKFFEKDQDIRDLMIKALIKFFEKDQDIREAVDAEDLLWNILIQNNIEEVVVEFKIDGSMHGSIERLSDFEPDEFRITPKSKTAILYEPILNNNLLALGRNYYYPSADVESLLGLVANEAVMSDGSLEIDSDECLNLIVTFFTKNKRISVDELGV